MKKALKRMAAAALVTLSVLRGGDAFAQNAVDGRVVDANGAPLVGVTVLIKGTQSGTATGANGSYSIKTREDQTLVFSYLGYTTVEEYVGKRTAINVKMTEEASQIGAVEIVNIGYGTTTRRDLTGSVAKADLGTMMKANVTNFDQALGGRIAGVVVTTGDGSLGAEANITIRGNNSLTQSNAPLYIIDGFPSEGSFAASINPADIESIDVLKDGSAAAIYGTRGTNGVILVTTKKAHAGENRIEFSAYVAMQSVDKKPDVMSASEYRNTIRQYFPDKASSYDFGGSTDWFDAITRKHPVSQNYNVSSSGGSAKLNYRASVSYTNDIGLVKKTGNEKLRGRLNVSQSLIRDRLKVDYNFAYTTGKGSYADKFIMRQAVLRNPTEPIYETNGNNPQYGKYFFSPGIDYHNPVAMLEQRDDEGIRKEFSGSVNASLRIIDLSLIHISEPTRH